MVDGTLTLNLAAAEYKLQAEVMLRLTGDLICAKTHQRQPKGL